MSTEANQRHTVQRLYRLGYLALALMMSTLSYGETTLPDNSLYQVTSLWKDQNGTELSLDALQGNIQIVAFVYSYCEHTCPTIVANLRQIDSRLDPDARQQVHYTLISLDPERDTPARLKAYMKKQKLGEPRWQMLSGQPDSVLELAALFGVRYKPMGDSDIAHSNMITVLSKQGVIEYQMKGLGEGLNQIVKAIDSLANTPEEQSRPPQPD